ncbi:dihydroxyacetone kinase subunit DhaL [Marinilactibacillus psychrotolerans]|uniref:phosphoenolpyruvate--glycerone phosphotransferase n=2 Tax=Marinilactibacillus psychrotolerans TaxID=191770 RepID=A0AAV3WPL6_9LACT|nr:dihydroxyacetone kinase subunit DhaL [Marinilactibacillus psychrotolerans]GEL65934.1 dihydroxyacetone kinase subunit L [Marinilactibacillus psychrotolerans]GEQ34790.1 dihydroxyacetone kinase [Marinilactibacillus psychrotolerans]SDC11333.1 dihydroxyacetone kinase, C-terminal domain [Marinilactibacillus psychrotolerans]SJN41353.1 Phosphoenolpyruvate-dihydroxyacetone phosphotransferase, ADP-binding subunit DhaL [Marinilactibacillus psychrotolerans 42ea]
MVEIESLKKWIELYGEKVTENKEHLNQLDSDIGDGDHGSNLTRGAAAVKEKVSESEYENLSDFFKDIGMTLVSKVGGASGPLYGSAFISMAKQAKESDDLAVLLEAGLDGIQKRGKAEAGEKTMVDEWIPVVEALKENNLTNKVIEDSLQKTKDMKATKGRASYLGDRSIGHIDPGAQSSAYLFESLLEAGVLNG